MQKLVKVKRGLTAPRILPLKIRQISQKASYLWFVILLIADQGLGFVEIPVLEHRLNSDMVLCRGIKEDWTRIACGVLNIDWQFCLRIVRFRPRLLEVCFAVLFNTLL